MAKKYRVHVRESERGWGSDYWHRDFDTQEAAQEFWDGLIKEYGGQDRAPDFYIMPQSMEVVEE